MKYLTYKLVSLILCGALAVAIIPPDALALRPIAAKNGYPHGIIPHETSPTGANFSTNLAAKHQHIYGHLLTSPVNKKAVAFPVFGPKGQFENIGMLKPSAPEDGIVVAIESSYICGTDLGKVRGDRDTDPKTKGILGHEAVGIVVALGSRVKGYKKGDRVLIDPNISCGKCINCKKGVPHLCIYRTSYSHAMPGFFAPWVVISDEAIKSGNVVKVSHRIPSKYAALSEPIGCALYDLLRAKQRVKGKSRKLVVWGAGFQGIMHAVLASLVDKPVAYDGDSVDVRYPEVIIFDTDSKRVQMAREILDAMGLYHVEVYDSSNMAPVQKEKLYSGADTSIIAFSPTTKEVAEKVYLEAASLTNRGGAVSAYGGTTKAWGDVSVGRVRGSEITFFGNTGAPTNMLKQGYKLIEEGVLSQALLDNLITQEIRLKDLPVAFGAAKSGKALKVRIICNEDPEETYLSNAEGELLELIDRAEADGLKNVTVSMLGGKGIYFMNSKDKKLIEVELYNPEHIDDRSLDAHLRIYHAADTADRKEPVKYIVQSQPDGVDEIFQADQALGPVCPEYVAVLNEKGPVPVIELTTIDSQVAQAPTTVGIEHAILDNHNAILLKDGSVITAGVNADQARYRNKVAISTAEIIIASQAMGSLILLDDDNVERLMPLEASRQALLSGRQTKKPAKVPTIKIHAEEIDEYRDEIEEIRQKLYLEGQEIAKKGLVDGPGGNISACTRTRRFMVIKASGKSFEKMAAEEYVVVDIASGKVVEGFGPVLKSSVETAFHRAIYQTRKYVFAVTHAHPIYASAVATAGRTFALHGTEIPRLPYIHPGGSELAEAVSGALKDCNMAIMANHGAVTVGVNISEALRLTIELEDMAKGIVAGEKKFQAQYGEYRRKKEELAGESARRDISPDKKAAYVKAMLGLKNELMHFWEELWLESEKVEIGSERLKSTEQLQEGKSLICNLRTKEIFLYDTDRKSAIESNAGEYVLLIPLAIPETAREQIQTLIHTLRHDRSPVSSEIALRILRAMEDNNIIPTPYLINDVFQHCHSTYSHSPGNSPEYIAYRGHRLGLLVTGKVDHDTVEGSTAFLESAEIIGTRNPTCGYEQRVYFKGTPFERMQTNSPGNTGETYIAVHGVVRRRHKIQEERVRPAKIARFRKTLQFIESFGIIPAGVNYDEHAAPLTELNNPTEKHVAEAIARQIYASYRDDIANEDWDNVYRCAETLVNAASGADKKYSLTDEDKEQIQDVVKFTFLMRKKVVSVVKQRPEYAPTSDEVITYDEFLEDVHAYNELSYYCYLGGERPCAAESREALNREQKQAFIDQAKGDSLTTEAFEQKVALPWLEMENVTMLHLFFMYHLFIGTDGIAFMPNRNSPEEIDEVIRIAREVGFEHIANGMDVNMPDMPYIYFFYTAREDFVQETLFIVEHENALKEQHTGNEPARADDFVEMPQELSLESETLKKYTACALYNMIYAKKFVEGKAEKLVIWDADLQGIVHAALAAQVDEVSYDEIIIFISGDEQAQQAQALFGSLGLSQVKVYDSTQLSGEEIDRLCQGTDTTVMVSSLGGISSNQVQPELTHQLYQGACRRTRRGGVLSLFNGPAEDQSLLDSWYNHYGHITFVGNNTATKDMLAWADRIIEENTLPQQLFDLIVAGQNGSSKSSSRHRNDGPGETVIIGDLTLRSESEVSKTPETAAHNFNADFYYRQRLFLGDRQIASIELAINNTAIALHVCFNFSVEEDMRNRGIGETLLFRAFVAATEEAKQRNLNPKWALFTSQYGGPNEDWQDVQRRMVPVTHILRKVDAKQFDWGWTEAIKSPDALVIDDAELKSILYAISPTHDSPAQIQFATLSRVIEVSSDQQHKTSSAGRAYETAEAEASTVRLESLLNSYFSNVELDNSVLANVDTQLQNEHGFELSTSEAEDNLIALRINPNILNRDALLKAIAGKIKQDISATEVWQQLQDQVWLDGKMEFAIRDVPWIQNTDIRVNNLYDPKVRLLVGLGKVRGSASYEAFYVNAYANQKLTSVQDIFKRAGYRIIPIPVQIATDEDKKDMPRILHSILRDRRIIRIALTQPVKVVAVDTGLFEIVDPDTLPTGAVNTAAIEDDGDRRWFVGRSTDGEGTTAKVKEALARTDKSLSDAIVGIIGLGGFGRAALGKFLTNADAPKEIRIAVRDGSYERVKETAAFIERAYEQGFSSRPRTQIKIFKYSELDHPQESHPFGDADVVVDATSVGMDDDNISLQYLDFIKPGKVLLHAAYRNSSGKNRIPPILAEAYKRGAIVHTGLADWVGHQWSQITEDLKRAEGLTPQMPAWRDQRWNAIGQEIEAVAKDWARNVKGLRDAMDVLPSRSGVQDNPDTAQAFSPLPSHAAFKAIRVAA